MATRSPNTPGNKNTGPERASNAPSPTRLQQPSTGDTRQDMPDERTAPRPGSTTTPPDGTAPDMGRATGRRPGNADPGDLDDEDSSRSTRSHTTGNEPPDR